MKAVARLAPTLGRLMDGVRPVRSPRSYRTVALFVSLALLVFGLAGIASGQTVAVDCNKPTIQHVTINQGTDGYAQESLPASTSTSLTGALAWGKDTIVRPQLTLSCSDSPATQTTDAELLILRKDTVPATPLTLVPLDPFAPLTSPFGSVTACCSPDVDAAADPKFLVSRSTMALNAPTGLAAPISLDFKVTVKYQTSTNLSGEVTATRSAVIGKRANALRLLVLPMGDKYKVQNTQDPQFTTDDNAALQEALATLSRIAPGADQLETLSDYLATAGIRWQIAPTMLDLGVGTPDYPGLNVLDSQGKFCGNDGNFTAIKNALNGFIQNHNSGQPSHKKVDIAVGVVGQNISYSSSSSNPSGCNDGQAAAPGNASWARMVVTTANTISNSGPVLGMEVFHNLGIVSPNDDRYVGWHSDNTEAEFDNRAYNLTTRGLISADRSVMNSETSGWNNDTVLAEAPDWKFAQCKLGAFKPYPGACGSTAGTIGTPASDGDPPGLFQIRGTINEETNETDLLSNVTGGGPTTPQQNDSGYSLVYIERDPTTGQRNGHKTFGLPVSFGSTDHHSPRDADEGVVEGSFEFLTADAQRTEAIQVWRGTPSAGFDCSVRPGAGETSGCLYEAELTRVPQVTRIEVTPTEWQFAKVDGASSPNPELEPNLSLESDYLTYVAQDAEGCWSIFVRDLADSGRSASRCSSSDPALRPSAPAMSPDNSAVSFVENGDLFRVDFDAATFTFGATTKLYACSRTASGTCVVGVETPLQGEACCPVWSPTEAAVPVGCLDEERGGQWLVFSVDGDLYRMFPFCDVEVGGAGAAKPELLTQNALGFETDTFETDPTISAANPHQPQLIAYTRREADGSGPNLWTLNPASPQTTQKQLLTKAGDAVAGDNPSWGGELVAYESEGRVLFVNPDNPVPELVTSDGSYPSLVPGFDRTIAIERSEDVYLGTVGEGRDITMIGTDDTASIERTHGFLLLDCGGVDIPIADLEPQRIDGEVVAFTLDDYDDALACTDAQTVGFISDTFSLSERFADERVDSSGAGPVAAFISPTPGTQLAGDHPISLRAAGWDTDGMVLGDADLQFALKVPGSDVFVDVPGTGGTKDVLPVNLGRSFWPSGTYTARITATQGGESDADFTTFSVLHSIVDFDPNTLEVASSGQPVTTYFTLTPQQVSQTKSVRIVEVGGFPTPSCVDTSRGCIPLTGELKEHGSTLKAQFDRDALTTFMQQHGLVGFYVTVVIDGCSTDTWTCGTSGDVFSGTDPSAPVTQPAS